MRKHWQVALALLLAPVLTGRSRADEATDVRALLDKAITAAGGEAKLTGLKGARWKSKVVWQGPVGQLEMTGEYTVQLPDKARVDTSYVARGKKNQRILVLDGDKAWEKYNDTATVEMSREMHEDSLEANYHSALTYLPVALKDPLLKLSLLPEAKVGDRAAVGLKVSHPKHRTVRLYYDKETGQLLKSETQERRRGKNDREFREVNVEAIYSDYKEVDGIRLPVKSRNLQDGKPYAEAEITEVKWLRAELDPSAFAKP